jgi:hypothetical protein
MLLQAKLLQSYLLENHLGGIKMRLTSVPIINFANINDFQTASQWTIRATDPQTLYFQLFDLDNQNTASPASFFPLNGGFFNAAIKTAPQRYIAGVGVSNQPFSMTVTFPSLDPSNTLIFNAIPDPNDASVWHIVLPGYTNTAMAPSSGNVIFSLTQGVNTVTWVVQNMIAVEMTNQGCC